VTVFEALKDALARRRQERGAHTPCATTKGEIKARRLQLSCAERTRQLDCARCDQFAYLFRRQDAHDDPLDRDPKNRNRFPDKTRVKTKTWLRCGKLSPRRRLASSRAQALRESAPAFTGLAGRRDAGYRPPISRAGNRRKTRCAVD
jgi:hypothetical protein